MPSLSLPHPWHTFLDFISRGKASFSRTCRTSASLSNLFSNARRRICPAMIISTQSIFYFLSIFRAFVAEMAHIPTHSSTLLSSLQRGFFTDWIHDHARACLCLTRPLLNAKAMQLTAENDHPLKQPHSQDGGTIFL